MGLMGDLLGGGAMIAAVFTVGIVIQILFDRRFGVAAQARRADAKAAAHQQAVRSQLGGFGPGGGGQR